VDKPVKREIFAADFRDRVVHHFIFNYISPVFEKHFINDSYSCRVGKGTHYGIQRIDHFIRSCSENYSKECYIMKLDIKGYFMSMNKKLIIEKIASLLDKEKMRLSFDLPLTLYLIKQTLFNDPTKDCIIKGSMSDWEGLPPTKSLFHAKSGCGLPIGNLTSQLFANIYLNEFDHFVKRDLKIRFYGRYVDDFALVHPDKNYLASIIPVIKNFLSERLQIGLHPDKIYMQHYSKGVKYLGALIKPRRIYIANRTKGNFHQRMETWNMIIRAEKKPIKEEQDGFLNSMNSYLGIMKHYRTYKLRKKMLKENLSAYFWNYFYIGKNYAKLERKIKK
jgi:retron-type reverse transcriptase